MDSASNRLGGGHRRRPSPDAGRVYNNLGQQTSLKDAGDNAGGNCTALTTAVGTVSYTYPVDSHRLPAVDGGARNHDSAGNTVGIDRREFVRNAANRMGAIKQGGAMMESYGYNHRCERVLRAPASGDAQLTLYDESGQWIGSYRATGQPQQQSIWLDNHPIALISPSSSGVPELATCSPITRHPARGD